MVQLSSGALPQSGESLGPLNGEIEGKLGPRRPNASHFARIDHRAYRRRWAGFARRLTDVGHLASRAWRVGGAGSEHRLALPGAA